MNCRTTRALGAVNTVLLRDGRRIGHNTDLFGFGENFRRGLANAARKRVVQVGAGGAGAAVAHALLSEGVEQLTIFDSDAGRATHLAADIATRFGSGRAVAGKNLAGAMSTADGVVNCTPVGMAKFPGLPLQAELLHPDMWVADIIYFPLETALLHAARQRGCRTLDGGGMAVFEAVQAFRLFTGMEPNAERMLRHFKSLL